MRQRQLHWRARQPQEQQRHQRQQQLEEEQRPQQRIANRRQGQAQSLRSSLNWQRRPKQQQQRPLLCPALERSRCWQEQRAQQRKEQPQVCPPALLAPEEPIRRKSLSRRLTKRRQEVPLQRIQLPQELQQTPHPSQRQQRKQL
jgi:hypothetical protein